MRTPRIKAAFLVVRVHKFYSDRVLNQLCFVSAPVLGNWCDKKLGLRTRLKTTLRARFRFLECTHEAIFKLIGTFRFGKPQRCEFYWLVAPLLRAPWLTPSLDIFKIKTMYNFK
jgi:hypothetical protein